MNVKQFLLGMFQGQRLEQEEQQVREVGRQHARTMYTAYVGGFEEEGARLLEQHQQRLLGYEPNEIEGEVVVDYAGVGRAELMRIAKERGIPTTRTTTRDELVGLLSE